jgi:serine/threonine protein kinase
MTTIANRYRLVREVGRGGTGAVWLAEDTVLAREVALKRIGALPGRSEADIDRVRREAHVSARLNHEHVVVVFDLVQERDEHWLVMEYVESENLAERVDRLGALPPDEAAGLIRQAAIALAAAHAAGIVHRDVKPSNLLVTPSGTVKLSDFGIARLESDNVLTQTGLVVGSPAFLAPEVAGGAPATPASDLWSLGATVFHAVEGHPPFPSDGNLMGLMYRIVHEEPPRPEHAGWLAPLVEHLMLRDPAARWDATRVQQFLERGPDQATATRTLPAVAAVAAPAHDDAPPPTRPGQAAPLAAEPPLEEPAPAPMADEDRGARRTWLIVAAAALAIVLVAVAAVLLTRGDENPTSPAADPTRSNSPSSSPSSASPSESPSESPSQSPSESPRESPSESPSESQSAVRVGRGDEQLRARLPRDGTAGLPRDVPPADPEVPAGERWLRRLQGFLGHRGVRHPEQRRGRRGCHDGQLRRQLPDEGREPPPGLLHARAGA